MIRPSFRVIDPWSPMMRRYQIEDLMELIDHDGGSLIPAYQQATNQDSEGLFKAWEVEREQSVEMEMLLKLSTQTIQVLLDSSPNLPGHDRLETIALLDTIQDRLMKPRRSRP